MERGDFCQKSHAAFNGPLLRQSNQVASWLVKFFSCNRVGRFAKQSICLAQQRSPKDLVQMAAVPSSQYLQAIVTDCPMTQN